MKKNNPKQRHHGWPLLRKMLIIMKITTMLFFIALFQVSARSYSQETRLSLKFDNETLENVFSKIEANSEFSIFYKNELIKNSKEVTGEFKDVLIFTILDQILKSENLTYTIKDKLIMIVPKDYVANENAAQQQGKKITGKVTDSGGSSLPGVTVVVKGTTSGVITDNNGMYSLSIFPDNATLQFSFVGMKTQEINVMGKSVINVKMEEETVDIAEVVAIGYGTQIRRNVTGSITKIDMKDTETLPNINVTQSFRGRVAGVQFLDNGRPGQNGSILIRGQNSLSANNSPLIVFDGIFFNGSLAEINPNDIKSMEVLKDASATAIYGSRAANGVILITSKSGSTEKPAIGINIFHGLSDRSYKVKLMTPDRYIQRILDQRVQQGLPADPNKIADYLLSSEAANWQAGKIVDPWDLVSQQSSITSSNLNISGKSKITSYFLSGSLVDEKGLYLNDNMKRISFRANLETKFNNWVTIGLTSTYSLSDYSGLEPDPGSFTYTGPFSTPFYEDGEPTQFLVPGETVQQNNPIRRALLTENSNIRDNLFANFYASIGIPFIKGLSYRFNYSPNIRRQHNYNFFRQDKHLTGNTTFADKYNREDVDWVLENILNYSNEFNKNNAIDVTLLYGMNHSKWESTSTKSDLLGSAVLGWNNLGIGQLFTLSSNATKSAGISSMIRVNYRFKNRYLFTFTTRRDGSSVFSENKKYAIFPSGAIAWVLSDEPFLQSNQYINKLKLRLSYGSVGNQAISPYQSLSQSSILRYVFGDGGSSSLGLYPTKMPNNDLKWETTYSTNIAVDFEMLKGRLGGTVELYDANTKNLLMQRSLPSMTGFRSIWTNLGQVNNKGIEVTLNTVNINKGKFMWRSNLVYSLNKNKIMHLYNSDINRDGKEDDDIGNKWFIGKPINVAYDLVFDGIYQEGDNDIPTGMRPGDIRFKDLNADGKINLAGDRAIIGQTEQPKHQWGIGNTFSYGDFSLSIFVNAMNGWIGQLPFPFEANQMYHYNKADVGWWTPANKSNTRPSSTYIDKYGHQYHVSRNFVRIQDVSLEYDLRKLLGRTPNFDCKLILAGKNLATFTDWLGSDPESGGSFSTIPTPRTVTLGFNLNF